MSAQRFIKRDIHRNIGFTVKQLRCPGNSENIISYLEGELVALIWTAARLKSPRASWIDAGKEARAIIAKIEQRRAKKAGGAL